MLRIFRKMTGHVYAVVGGREGAGVTTTALALGASLAEMSHRVGIVDADFGDEGIAAALDLPDGPRLRDVLRGEVDLADALVEGPHGIEILPSEPGVPEPTDVRLHALVRATSKVRERFDVVLIDLGAGGGVPAAVALERADEVLLATPPDFDAVTAAADAATTARHHGADVLGTVLTRTSPDTGLGRDALRETLGTELLALVPEDEAVPESAAERTSLLHHDPDSRAAMVYWELAMRLVDGDADGLPVVADGAENGEQPDDPDDEPDAQPGESADPAGDGATASDEEAPREPAATAETDGASGTEFEWQDDDPDADSGDADDEEDEMQAAFKQTMEKVRKEREAEKRASGDDDEKGLFDGLIG